MLYYFYATTLLQQREFQIFPFIQNDSFYILFLHKYFPVFSAYCFQLDKLEAAPRNIFIFWESTQFNSKPQFFISMKIFGDSLLSYTETIPFRVDLCQCTFETYKGSLSNFEYGFLWQGTLGLLKNSFNILLLRVNNSPGISKYKSAQICMNIHWFI